MESKAANTGRYDYSADKLKCALEDLVGSLEQTGKEKFDYRMVSRAHAGPAERAYFEWTTAGQRGQEPRVDPASFRAMIYGLASSANQLSAFLHVQAVATTELARAAINGFNAKEIIVPLSLMRSLIERFGHAYVLVQALKSLSDVKPADTKLDPLINLSDIIGRALYGTKVDWQKVRSSDLRTVKSEQLAYVKKEFVADWMARSVLTSIDKLNTRIPGLRNAYDLLCEFLHPNVGDLFATTLKVQSFNDSYQTRHLIRTIGVGPKDLTDVHDLNNILSNICEIVIDVVKYFPEIVRSLINYSEIATRLTKKNAHVIRSLYPHHFKKDDLCPCMSGLKIRRCKLLN